MRVEYDGNTIEDDFIFGMVSNTASVAGMLSMQEFVLDDGLFEVMLIKKPANPIQLQSLLRSVLRLKGEIDKTYIKFFKTNRIRFTSVGGETVTWTRDGEYGGNYISNTIVNNNRAISFIVNHRVVKISHESLRSLIGTNN